MKPYIQAEAVITKFEQTHDLELYLCTALTFENPIRTMGHMITRHRPNEGPFMMLVEGGSDTNPGERIGHARLSTSELFFNRKVSKNITSTEAASCLWAFDWSERTVYLG